MSLQFNDTTTFRGIAQMYEKEIGVDREFITGDTNRMKEFTADANLALDRFWALSIPASGTWQLDDSNQTDYPIITTDLVADQRDYTFTTDESGNLILDIYRAFIYPNATDTIYYEITPIDQQSDVGTEGYWDGQSTTGVPNTYDKTANGIFLDPIPDYNATNGLKIMINREASYFTTTDTTKKPGVPGLFHAYFYKVPALEFAKRNDLKSIVSLRDDVERMEMDIVNYFSKRARDEEPIIIPEPINYK